MIARIAVMICCSGRRIESAIRTPAVRMMPRKITAIDSTRREISASVRSNVSCAFCSRWRILVERPSIAPIASAWLASIVLRSSSVRLASCSASFAKPSRSAAVRAESRCKAIFCRSLSARSIMTGMVLSIVSVWRRAASAAPDDCDR